MEKSLRPNGVNDPVRGLPDKGRPKEAILQQLRAFTKQEELKVSQSLQSSTVP